MEELSDLDSESDSELVSDFEELPSEFLLDDEAFDAEASLFSEEDDLPLSLFVVSVLEELLLPEEDAEASLSSSSLEEPLFEEEAFSVEVLLEEEFFEALDEDSESSLLEELLFEEADEALVMGVSVAEEAARDSEPTRFITSSPLPPE